MGFFSALFTVLGEYTATIIAGLVIAGGAGMVLSPKGRILIKSGWNWLTSTAANNPKLAAGAYDEKIKQLRENLQKAQSANSLALGEVARETEKKELAEKQFETLKGRVKTLEAKGKHEEALRTAQEAKKQQGIAKGCEERLPKLIATSEYTKKTVKEIEKLIDDYETRKDKTISDMETAKLQEKVANMLHGIEIDPIDGHIAGIEKSAENQKYRAIGATISYEDSDKKRLQAAAEEADSIDTEVFLQQLLAEDNNAEE